MPKGYVIARAVVTDAEAWSQYAAKATAAQKVYGGNVRKMLNDEKLLRSAYHFYIREQIPRKQAEAEEVAFQPCAAGLWCRLQKCRHRMIIPPDDLLFSDGSHEFRRRRCVGDQCRFQLAGSFTSCPEAMLSVSAWQILSAFRAVRLHSGPGEVP